LYTTAMYVRWQSRERNRPQYGPWQGPDIHWSAIIVENMRIDGKPRQLHVAYLAGFTESAINHEAQRCYLWDHISERLDQLANQMTTATRERIEAAVANKVPRPTVAQYKAVARRNGPNWRRPSPPASGSRPSSSLPNLIGSPATSPSSAR
jgi:hypothetical protein